MADDRPALPEFLTEAEDGSIAVTLRRAFTVDGVAVRSITLREPCVDDRIAAEKAGTSDMEREIVLVGNLAEIDPAQIRRLPMKDYGRVQEALRFFLG